ncbi:patatin-like phospholipase family protein [Cellvibrio sp.]|uniref:patatin-like phospholipase family protein n=1 Tax=Cellvibrio sp. TaxID=1965322 RepID=UPI0039647581
MQKFFSARLFLMLIICIHAFFTQAQTATEPQQNTQTSPRIALVLGGGGARGAAHIGVLEVLERERIPLACVVGTSMGGLTAGAYAAGLSSAEMREKLDKADWTDLFLDSADYSELGFRKKRVTNRFLSGAELGLTKRGVTLKSGVIAGTKIKLFFNLLVGADYAARNIEEMPIPLALVATDIGTGEKFVFKRGSLPLAMRASMSVPGLMTPVDYEGHKLVDGGLVDNLPISVARELCHPDVIIAVNVGTPLKPAEEIDSLLSVTTQMIDILAKQNVAQSISTLRSQDIYIEPALGEFSAADFLHYKTAADIGKAAAEAKIDKLKQYSVSEVAYTAWRNEKKGPQEPVRIDEIAISPLKDQSPDYIQQHIRQKVNKPLDVTKLEQDLIRLYGDGFYENVDYTIASQESRNILKINAREATWSSDYFTFGFDINNEYRQGTNFDLRGAYRSTWINHHGGELFGSVDIGSNPGFEAELYQPLNYRQTYFVQPSIYRKSEMVNVFQNDNKVAEYEVIRAWSEFALGRNLGNFGQAKFAWREYDIKSISDLSSVDLGNSHDKFGGTLLDINIDRRNRLHFPSRGWSTQLSYFESTHEGYGKFSSEFNFAYPLDKFVLAGRTTYIRSTFGQLPPVDAAYLGGFLNLSAYASNQIIADNALYTHLRGERIIGRMPLGFNGDLRLGFGLEAAKLKRAYTYDETDGWLNSAVIYLGGETPLGPAYLGVGFADDGKLNLYMQVGAH